MIIEKDFVQDIIRYKKKVYCSNCYNKKIETPFYYSKNTAYVKLLELANKENWKIDICTDDDHDNGNIYEFTYFYCPECHKKYFSKNKKRNKK